MFRRKRLAIISLVLGSFVCLSVKKVDNEYYVRINLNSFADNVLIVKIAPPKISQDSALFALPQAIKGTFIKSNYGQFVRNIKAYNKAGDELPILRHTINTFLIPESSKLAYLEYVVQDTDNWDMFAIGPGSVTVFEANKCYVLNHHAIIGYVVGSEHYPYRVEIVHPPTMYGTCGQSKSQSAGTSDHYQFDNYDKVVDNPMMYCRPDTATIRVKNSRIHLSTYANTERINTAYVKELIEPVLPHCEHYLGRHSPEDYAFIIYMGEKDFGALEHYQSSLYFMQVTDFYKAFLDDQIKRVIVHEILHRNSPFNVHSDVLHNFNYTNPKLSKHLWFYEGVNEYLTLKLLAESGQYSTEAFFRYMGIYLFISEHWKYTSLTRSSQKAYDKEYKVAVFNNYFKGALAAFIIDLMLNEESNGKKDLLWLMQELASRYSIDKPFPEDDFFDILTDLTMPDLFSFLTFYIAGTNELPLSDYLGKLGYRINGQIKSYPFKSTDHDNTFDYYEIIPLQDRTPKQQQLFDLLVRKDRL